MAKFVIYSTVDLVYSRLIIGTTSASCVVEAETEEEAIKKVQEAGCLSQFDDYKLEDRDIDCEEVPDLKNLGATLLEE